MDKYNFPSDKNIVVSLVSGCNFLALSVLENLLSKNCYVNIVSEDVKKWQENLLHISSNRRFSFMENKNSNNIDSLYSIFVLGYGIADPYDELNKILKNHSVLSSKVLILLPFEKYSGEENSRFNFSGNLGVIYLGDLLGARMDLEDNLLITKSLRDIYFKKTLTFPVGEVFYPLFVNDVSKTISRWLFSFGPYGKETLLIGSQTSTSDFWKENVSIVGEINITYDTEVKPRQLPRNVEIKTLDANLKFLLTETYRWLSKFPPRETKSNSPFLPRRPVKVNPKLKEKPVVKNKKVYPKYLKPVLWFVFFALTLPVFLLIVASGLFFVSYKQFVLGNDSSSQNLILIAKTLSVASKEESRLLKSIPVLGSVYRELYFAAYLGEKGSEVAITSIPLVRASSDLVNKVLGNEIYDPNINSSTITGALDTLYKEVSLVQEDTKEAALQKTAISKFLLSKVNFDRVKSLTNETKGLSQNLPKLLGKGGIKTYLILFQNNMELRPTGGFIGSFGILTFDGGRISDLTVNDVYSADGQLNGHVEPPPPIKKYLGEANWWLRDSNWDPDFPTSAKRAEWFLDKEMGKSVDGVVGIDLEPIKNILKLTGPIFLPDFNMDITSENLYERTQAEVEQNFFPGTHKKASFLTALSRSLLADVSNLNTTQKLGVLKYLYSDLEGRSIQMFFHDDDLQNNISALRWDGGVVTPDCGKKCYPDLVGVVEANVGVNKTNYFIEREAHLTVKLSPDRVARTLTIILKNNANPALGASSVYKTYARLLSGGDTTTSSAKLYTGQSSQILPSEVINLKGRNETGVYFEILGGQSKTLEFTWTSTLDSNAFDQYGVYLRKQAGTGPDPVSLTVNGISIYNGLLTGDVFSRVNW